MRDIIYRQSAINAIENTDCELSSDTWDELTDAIMSVPSAQPELCDGCKWEYAFGYGECHHCKRRFNDMYEETDNE